MRLTKKLDGVVLTFVRRDGSITTSRSRAGEFFALHDLMHYAVESVLGYRQAFLGLLAEGVDIQDWEDAASSLRKETPAEAIQAEALVGLLQLRWAGEGAPGIASAPPDALAADMREVCQKLGVAPAVPTGEKLRQISEVYGALVQRWERLSTGESLDLPWPA